MKKFGFIFIILPFAFISEAQPANCIFKLPQFTLHFGAGNVKDPNSGDLSSYQRVSHSCPRDGYYSFASYTSACFNDDWHTLSEDHTAGDAGGNMLLVNAGQEGSAFLRIPVRGLKSNTTYELGLWLINLCKPTKKCPFPLLPKLNIRLETPEGKLVARIVSGELPRIREPQWTKHRAYFTTPSATSTLMLVMIDDNPSGCGNDFALDDITFRECVKQIQDVTIQKTSPSQKSPPATKLSTTPKPAAKKPAPRLRSEVPSRIVKPKNDTASKIISVVKQNQKIFPPPPLVLKTRENLLARKIETEAGEIKIELYDNGQIDGDTVSIYHNNSLIRSRMRLSEKPIAITIEVDPSQPHHEIIMVAENLGSIPPNTSIMIITTANNRYEVFISSSEQKNAKVVLDLKN